MGDGRHLSTVKSSVQGQGARAVRPEQKKPRFFRYLCLRQLDPGMWAAAVAPPAPLSRRGTLPAFSCIIRNSSGFFGTLIRVLPRLHIPRLSALKVIKQLTWKVAEREKYVFYKTVFSYSAEPYSTNCVMVIMTFNDYVFLPLSACSHQDYGKKLAGRFE